MSPCDPAVRQTPLFFLTRPVHKYLYDALFCSDGSLWYYNCKSAEVDQECEYKIRKMPPNNVLDVIRFIRLDGLPRIVSRNVLLCRGRECESILVFSVVRVRFYEIVGPLSEILRSSCTGESLANVLDFQDILLYGIA